MTTRNATRRRKAKPYNPAVHDRRAQDLLRNAQVAIDEVDDPLALEPGDKIVVLRSTRDDPLAEMLARNQIDKCDYEAGRHWQRAYENAEIGGARAIDPTKEAVDGGRMPETLTDRQMQATDDLIAARHELGELGNWIIISVLGTRKSLLQLARESAGKGGPFEAEYKYLRRRFNVGLGKLAVLFGYATRPHHSTVTG